MPVHNPAPRPATSPWGSIQTAEQLHPGIWHVTTASHGGFLLSHERQTSMPPSLKRADSIYEEDVDYALVMLAFADEFAAKGPTDALMVRNAHDTVRNWYPERYADFTGRPVEARDSHVLALRDAYRERIGRAVVVAAFGSWADWVPEGKTGVIARILTGVDHLARPSYADGDLAALVDAARYERRRSVIALDELDAELC